LLSHVSICFIHLITKSLRCPSFEQLCINYANERLQQKYVVDNFRAIQHEYTEEGVNIFDFSLVDNTDVIELLEGKLGLITQLNEESMKKGLHSTDENFVYKVSIPIDFVMYSIILQIEKNESHEIYTTYTAVQISQL
jgi:myosin heavy subunit